MPKAIYRILFLFFCLLTTTVAAQQKDVVLWEGFTLEYQISDKLSASLKSQLRLENNISQFKSAYTSPKLTYKITNDFRISLAYRFSLTPTQNKHRLSTDLSYRYKIKKPKIQLQARLKMLRETIGNEKGGIPEYYIRPKLGLKYNLKQLNLQPYFSSEIFYNMSKFKQEFDRYRFVFGLDYDITKRNTLTLSYTFQKNFNSNNHLQSNIINFGLIADITVKANKNKSTK